MNLKLILVALAIGLLFGCTHPRPRPIVQDELNRTTPGETLERAKPVKLPGPPPFTEKMAPLAQGIELPPKLYSLLFNQAPLREVITAIIRDTELNLSIESEIDLSRTVTVHLKEVKLTEALDAILVNGAGYAWEIRENTLRVKRFEERIYHLDYLDMVSETDVDVGGDMLASGIEDTGVAGKFQVKVKKEKKSSDLWSAVEASLEVLKTEDGILRLNRNSGIVYMADTPRTVATMVRFLDSLSESLHRQVFIEAKIMEVVLNDDHKYGIDWTKLDVQFTSEWGALPDVFSLGFNSGGNIALGDSSRFRAVLDFLRTQGDVTILSNPHLSVMNRQSAVLTVGFQFPYADVEGVDRDLETGVVTIGTSIKRAILGLQLGITPQISGKGIVTLHIVPTITRIQREEQVEIPSAGFAPQVISNPVIDLQELATTVRVREGNSFVLAGLISKIRTLNAQGLPVFEDIPYIGRLFQHMETSEENKELVVFVTPYIKEPL